MWYNFIKEINNFWYSGEFVIWKSYYETILNYSLTNWVKEILLVKPVEDYVYKNFLKISSKLEKKWIILSFLEDKISFLLSHNDFLINYKKPPIMETFYRFMRKKFDILMDWNYPLWWK